MLLPEQSEVIKRHQARAPVRVVELAVDLGLSVYAVPNWDDNISGMIKRDAERGGRTGFAIYVNGKHARVRRRFTIAHEIAHFILHQGLIGDGIVEDALLRATGLTNSIERQANTMAANILMPWHLIEPEIATGRSIESLAAMLEVSRDAISYRVLGLSYDDAQSSGRA
jgi:sirohydrochlorin ferrochelatase